MFGFGGWQLQERRSRARDRATWLLRDHGDDAEAVLDAELTRPDLSVTRRARLRLIRSALRRKRRVGAPTVSRAKPAGASLLARLAAAFGIRRRRHSARRGR